MQDKTVIIQPSPFRASKVMVAQQGMTVMQMITQMYDLSGVPAVWRDYAVMVEVNGIPVTRDKWTQRPSTDDHVMIHVPVHGGGGGGGKDPIRTILSIAVVVAAVALTVPTGGGSLTLLGLQAGGFASTLVGVGVLTAGMFLVDALCPIRTPDSPYIASRSSYADSPTYSISGASNRANPFGPVPVVLGKHRVFPPYGAQPYTEILGNDEYLRMLFVWGYGRLDISDIKIGDTLLTSYTDYEIETVEGTSTDADITLIPDIVTQTSVNVSLTAAGGRVVRTAEAGSDELSVDIVFPRGLAYFDNNGNRTSYTVSVRVEYRKVGTLTWITQHTFTRTDATSSAIRVGHSWAVDKTKTYEVALTRLTADTDDTRTIDDVMWSVLRSIKNDPPVTFPKPLAMTALRIKATEQLQGVIDSLNAIVTSYAPTWDAVSGEWTTEESLTQNPAALFRLVLMHPANARPRTAAQIDDAGLGAWYVFCETNGYKFNMVRDYKSSGWETLADIAATGRASPTLTDGIWGVIIDEPDKPVIQHITPRNSWGFSSEKVLFDKPHAFRIPFTNEDEGYEKDERIVYDDGYNENNATLFESIEFPGITDPDLIWKFGRYYIAAARLRPETYSLYQDFEHLAVRRGQKVRVSHDVPMWGSGWGRVKSVIIGDAEADPPTDPTKTYGVVLDEKVVMAAGESYACRFRLADESNTSLSLSVVNDGAGESATLTFTTPITTTDGPQEGDLAMFGEANTETVELLVKGIERASDYTAKLILVDEAPHIYTADTGEIPAFVTHITGPIDVTRSVPDPPAIVGIVTGDVGADTFSGTVKPRILVHLRHDSGKVNVKTFRVRYRVDGSYMWSFAEAPAIAGTVICNEIVAGQTYEIWAQSISAYGVESAWVAGDNTVATGRTEWTPGTVQYFAVNISASGTLVLSWTRQAYLEIANYEIREGDDWDTATLVDTVNATSYRLGVALAGTYNYLIKAIDTSGNYSTVASEADITIAVPSTPEPSAEAVGEWAVVTWDDCKTSLPISYYKVNTAQRSNALRYTERINWVGKKDYSIVAIDIAGNESAAGTTSLTVTALLAVSGIAPTGLTYAVRLALTYTTFTGFECVEIWASATNNRADATKVGETAATVWTHSGLDLVDTRYYWTRTRDVYGNYSAWYPSSATAGVAGTTSTDPADYLSVLAGSITEDELYQTLNDRIDQIDTEAFLYESGVIENGIYIGLDGVYSGLYEAQSRLGVAIATAQDAANTAQDAANTAQDAVDVALATAATAITSAAKAQGTADGKVTTYYQTSVPTAESVGDLWIDAAHGNTLYRAESAGASKIATGQWVTVQDAAIVIAIANAATAQSTADNKIVTFYADDPPYATSVGDLWFDTNDGNKLYRSTAPGTGRWVMVRDAGITTALATIRTLEAEVAALTTSEWSATGDYTLGKYVVYGSEVYRCIQGYTYAVDGTKTPGVDTAYWEEADALATLVSSIETRVDSLEGEVETKVSATTFDALENRVDVAESSITQNASDILLKVAQSDFDLLEGRVTTAESDIVINAQGIQTKVDQTEFDAMGTRVTIAESAITQNASDILLKVAQTDFDLLTGRVETAESSITQNTNNILLRVTQTEFDAFSVLFLPEFSTGNTYEINDWVQYEGASYKCIQTIDFTPAPLPTNATYWESATYANEFTTVMNQVDINTSGISLMSSAITGDLTYLFDTEENRTFETGVYVESAEDIRDLDIRLTQAGMDIDGAEANIALHASLIDGIDDRLSQAEIDIDGANAQIALKASQSSLDETNAELAAAEVVIDGHTSSIALHASKISTLESTTGTHTTQINQALIDINAAEAAIELKAAQTALDTTNSNLSSLTGRVSTAETAISAGEAGTWSSISSKATAATVNALDTRVGTVETGISGLQTQIDGKIETYYTDTDPNTWASGDRTKHTGDMWYAPTTHLLKRYDGTLNSWSTIEDQKAIDAYTNAARAQDTADGKRRVFVTTPTTPYDVGDLWSGGSSGDLKRCKTQRLTGAYQAGDWELASKYTDDSSLTTFISTYNNDQKVGGVLRISTAESNISTLQSNMSTAQSDITDRVTVATYNADQKVDGVLRIAAAESTLSAQGGDITNMKAQYTLKLNANGRVAGIGLMLDEDSPSEFIVLADKFQVVNPTDTTTPKAVFTVGNINGVSAVGINGDLIIDGSILARNIGANEVIANSANIKNAIITGAKIANAAIDTAHIAELAVTNAKINDLNASKINAGYLSADRIEAGTLTGAKISAATTITAGSGNNVAVLTGDDATYRMYAGNASPGSAPFRVKKSGEIYCSSGKVEGSFKVGGVLSNNSLFRVGWMQDRGTISGGPASYSFSDYQRSLSGFFVANSTYIITELYYQFFKSGGYSSSSTDSITFWLTYNGVALCAFSDSLSPGQYKSAWYNGLASLYGVNSTPAQNSIFSPIITNSKTALVEHLSASGASGGGGMVVGVRLRIAGFRIETNPFPSAGWGTGIWEG